MSQLGLISSVLEEEIKEKLRKYGIVVWLDKDKHYSAYVDELVERHARGEFFAPVVAFRGTYLEMLLGLESYNNREDPDRLLIHMPGHTEESIRKTPVLELYHAGYRYRKALDTLIREATTGRVSPAEIEHYFSSGVSDLAAAEQWLENAISQPQNSLASYLESLSLEWIVDGMLGEGKVLQSKVYDEATVQTLAEHLYRHTGMDSAFLCFFHGDAPLSFHNLSEVFAAWLMCVEYVHDLARSPHLDILKPLQHLSLPLRRNCDQLIRYMRQRYADIYVAIAQRVEFDLQQELDAISPEDLGQIDTFQREETVILEGALQALLAGKWEKVQSWANRNDPSFWLQRDPTRRLVWSLVGDAANLGYLIESADRPLKTVTNLREALEHYTQCGYEVDRSHRRFEQQRLKLLEPTLPYFAQLLEAADGLRVRYRAWADVLAEDFANLCATEGFLPDEDLQQRSLYDQVVHPLTQGNKVAYFLISTLR